MIALIYVPPSVSVTDFVLWLYTIAIIGVVLLGSWPRPVTRVRRVVSALVVAVVLSGALMSGVKHAGIMENPCELYGDGWWKWLCEVMP